MPDPTFRRKVSHSIDIILNILSFSRVCPNKNDIESIFLMVDVLLNTQSQHVITAYTMPSLPDNWKTVHKGEDILSCISYVHTHIRDSILEKAISDNASKKARISKPLPVRLPEALVCPYRAQKPSMRLFVFPHAGAGSSAYHAMAKAFKDFGIEVVIAAYPGREIRFSTKPAQSMEELVADFQTHMTGILELGPFAFYGHSMGALACFEYTKKLVAQGQDTPRFLILTGRQAPSIQGLDLKMSHMPDKDFIQAVGLRYNAIPQEVINTPELLELLIPALRADFNLVAEHQYRPAIKLSAPTILINGSDDPWISPETATPWNQDVTVTEQYWLRGNHFFLSNNIENVKEIVLNAFSVYG